MQKSFWKLHIILQLIKREKKMLECRPAHFEKDITRPRSGNNHFFWGWFEHEIFHKMSTGFPKNTWSRALQSKIACPNISLKPATLTHFWPMVSLYTPWNNRKRKGFMVFLGGLQNGKIGQKWVKNRLCHLGHFGKCFRTTFA